MILKPPQCSAVVAFRALHCQLQTPSFLAYCLYSSKYDLRPRHLSKTLTNALCRHPHCNNIIPTASHVLIDCAQIKPVVAWLCLLRASIRKAHTCACSYVINN